MFTILEEIEGKRGEEMATAMLRVLLLRSGPARDAVLTLLDGKSPVGPITWRSHFSCYLEHGTNDEENGRGRMDLVMELDDSVIGIETKLFAAFQPSQPQRYFAEIDRLTEGLNNLRGTDVRSFMVVLAPDSRREEIESQLNRKEEPSNKRVLFLCWREVRDSIETVLDQLDSSTRFLFEEWSSYLKERTTFLPRLTRWMPHLVGPWCPKGTPLQHDFLARIWSLFPNPGPRLGSGEDWTGYYFRTGTSPRDWFGFMPNSRFSNLPEFGSSLVIAIPEKELPVSEHFTRLMGPNWNDGVQAVAWKVNFSEEWTSPEIWTKNIRPFIKPANEK